MKIQPVLGVTLLTLAMTTLGCDEKKPEASSSSSSAASGAKSGAPSPGKSSTSKPSGQATSPSALPTAAPPDKGAATGADWYKDVPAKDVPAKVGDKVWALYSDNGNAVFGLAEVTSLEGQTATLQPLMNSADGTKMDTSSSKPSAGVPGLFIIKARSAEEVAPKEGDWVIAYRFNSNRPPLSKVKKVDGSVVTINYGSSVKDEPREEKTLYVEKPGKGAAPFGYCATKQKHLLVVAAEGDAVFGIDTNNNFIKTTKADCTALTPVQKERKVGDEVICTSTMMKAKIRAVKIPLWYFDVEGCGPTDWDRLYDKI